MNQNNFFVQLFSRLYMTNPMFFKYIQWVSIAVAAITGLPEVLQYFGIALPSAWIAIENTVLAKCALVAALIARLPNNTPTPPAAGSTSVKGIVKMILFLVGMFFCMSVSAQVHEPFWGRLKTPAQVTKMKLSLSDGATSTDSVFQGIRAQGTSIVYGYSGGTSSLMAGVGVGYEHDTYNSTTGTWYTDWEVGPMLYGGGSVAPSSLNGAVAVGLQGQVLNRYLTAGIGYNFMTKNLMYVIGINFDLFGNQ
jgi:hypothetical protein